MIDEKEFTGRLSAVFSECGLSKLLSKERAEKFYRLTVRLLVENEKYNLTAITEPDKIILHHYADCAALAARLPRGARVADIGCGAGFPTLPIAILRDDVTVCAIDSTAKRIGYVAETAEMLGLSGVRAVAMRAEDGARDAAFRERFDVVTARAVAELRVLTELCLGYVSVGGCFMAMKGKNAEYELSAAKKAISIMGGASPRIETVTLSSGGEVLTHPLVIIKKGTKTPAAYPRPYAQISKKPL